jgi:hypothetical protein
MVTSDSKDKQHRSRVEREVLEILEKAEREQPPITDLAKWRAVNEGRKRRAQIAALSQTVRQRLTPGIILVMGIALAVIAFATRHGQPGVSRVFALAAIICIVLPFIMGFRKPAPDASIKRWRGRDLHPTGGPDTPVESLKRWWRSRQP